MKSKAPIVAACVVAMLAMLYFLSGTTKRPVQPVDFARPPALFLVFVDVTNSLDAEEIRAAANLARRLVWAVPQGARMVVLPVTSDVERGREFLDETVPTAATSQEMATLQAWRIKTGKKLRSDILSRAPEVNQDPNQARSCVSESLRRAEGLIGSRPREAQTEIVLISDMIEDCADSLEGVVVKLAKPHIKVDLERLRNSMHIALVNLHGARVTGVIPTAAPTIVDQNEVAKPLPRRPPVHELRQYWRAILDRCGDDPKNYSVSPDLPDRFQSEIPTDALEDDRPGGGKSAQ